MLPVEKQPVRLLYDFFSFYEESNKRMVTAHASSYRFFSFFLISFRTERKSNGLLVLSYDFVPYYKTTPVHGV